MISSKKIDLIAILLVALVLVGVVFAMFLPQTVVNKHSVGSLVYDELHTVNISEDDYYTTYVDGSVAKINLNGASATSGSHNVDIDGGTVTILGGGVYVLSGNLDDGSIIVDSADGAEVRLVLNNVNITSSDFSAIYIKQAEKTVISLVPDTENTLTDASTYNEEKTKDGKPASALYSKDDLVINGTGSLVINGNYQDGIKANDLLKITEGTITINAVDDGINANDYIAVLDAKLTIVSGGDGIKCEHENSEKGFIAFETATLSITGEGDGISASSALYINDTIAQITTGGGSKNAQSNIGMGKDFGFGQPAQSSRGNMRENAGFEQSAQSNGNNMRENASSELSAQRGRDMGQDFDFSQSEDIPSTKALKAGTNIVINGGSYVIDSCDDAIHSDGDLTVEEGTFTISAGDDGVHAETNLVLNPETIDITKCYEGLESAYITINGGDISIISSDDGINSTGKSASDGMGRMGGFDGEEKIADEDIWLTINGGNVYIETSGDGIDSNGSAVINGGNIEVYGPENSGNGSIDVGDGGYVFMINGGSLLAAGSSGMAESPSDNSGQQSLTFYLDETYQSDSSIAVIDSSGKEVISGNSSKSFNWVCVSTNTLIQGETYTLVINGNEAAELTADDVVAISGTKNGFGGQRGFGSQGGFGGQGGLERGRNNA